MLYKNMNAQDVFTRPFNKTIDYLVAYISFALNDSSLKVKICGLQSGPERLQKLYFHK